MTLRHTRPLQEGSTGKLAIKISKVADGNPDRLDAEHERRLTVAIGRATVDLNVLLATKQDDSPLELRLMNSQTQVGRVRLSYRVPASQKAPQS